MDCRTDIPALAGQWQAGDSGYARPPGTNLELEHDR